MAIVVENGTGLDNAESYVSVAEADARLANLGYTTWAPLQTVEKEQALRRATNYMVQEFRSKWKGARLLSTQILDWPRSDVYVDDILIASTIVPLEVKNTNIDLAIKAAAGDLNPDTTQRVIREKIGPLEQEFSASGPSRSIFRAAWMSLAPYLDSYAGSNQVIR